MRRTPWPRLVGVAVASLLVALAILRILESAGHVARPVPTLVPATIGLIAAVVLGAGWNVRKYTLGERPGLDPIVAARTVVLATAACYTGALLTGWYGAQALAVVGDWGIDARREIVITAGVAAVAAIALAVVGAVVERWCEVRPPDDDPGDAVPGVPA